MNASNDTTATAPAPVKPVYEVDSWQATLDKSATLFERSGKARKQASNLLWKGAQEATQEWMDGNSDRDVNAEELYANVLDILGVPRKGDASKIKTVALAVKNNGLTLSQFPNLSKAYAEATRLTKTVKVQQDEDTAADEAVAAIEAPKSASSAENAALIVLSKGVDEAARLLLDALGASNTAAHRAFMRAISQEIAGRIQPAPKPTPAKKATPAKKTAKKATVAGDGATKAKPAPAKKTAAKKAAPVTAKPKPAPAPVEDTEADSEPTVGDMFDEVMGDEGTEDAPSEAAVATDPRPKPARRGPVRRGAGAANA